MVCDICGRDPKEVGDGEEYKHGMQFILEMEKWSIPPMIRKQKILVWDLCNECELSMDEQSWDLFEELNKILGEKNAKL